MVVPSLAQVLGPVVLSTLVAFGDADSILPGFESPDNEFKPRLRYWLPDASVPIDQVSRDIKFMSEVGAGGFQLNPFYNFGLGDPMFPPVSEWDEYGFGTEAFKKVFAAALDAAEENSLAFEFSLGASQGQGVPAKPMTPGLAVHLVYGETTVKGGEAFSGEIPEPDLSFNFDKSSVADVMSPLEPFGPSKLIGVVAAAIKSSSPVDELDYSQVVVEESTLVDLTDLLIDETLDWTAPSDHDEYVLFAVYERFTNQRSCVAPLDAQDVLTNGSWITDHFSSNGADLVIDLWENTILDDNMKQKLKSVGTHTWEDSMEIQAGVFWSSGLLDRWESRTGYNPVKYLPFLFQQSNSYRAEYPPYNKTFLLGNSSEENTYLQDYRETLSEGYAEYLLAYEAWAQSLGLEHSAEVSYHVPVDMSSHVPLVGRPELESLAFPDVDHMRQFMGPAHLSGRNVVSSEVGAVDSGAYTLSLQGLATLFKDEFAAGVNMMVLHGMPYTGEYLSTWPGYTPAAYVADTMVTPRTPSWNYLSDTLMYAARNQLVLQTGTPKRDIAFYLYKSPWHATTEFKHANLERAGYSYEYLGPQNLASDDAIVEDGVLSPQGPSYRALVFDHQTFISPEAYDKVIQFAEQSLPIVVIGALPNTTIGATGQDAVSHKFDILAKHPNVHFIAEAEDLRETLPRIGVLPRVFITAPPSEGPLHSFWRSTDDNMDYVYFYNKGPTGEFRLAFFIGEEKVPYMLDAWTGKQTTLVYSHVRGVLSLSLQLAQLQTAIFALRPATPGGGDPHAVEHTANVETVESVPTGCGQKLIASVRDLEPASVKLSDGTEFRIECPEEEKDSLPSIDLGHWDLTLQSWEPSPDNSDSRSMIRTIELGPQDELKPWSNIPGVQNVSGVGIYKTSFSLPEALDPVSPERTAVLVHFGQVLDGLRAWVNGHVLPPLDISHPEADITEFLVPGENHIRVEASSTLFNAVKARVEQLESVGIGPLLPFLYTEVPYQPYGLVGPVMTRVLRKVVLE